MALVRQQNRVTLRHDLKLRIRVATLHRSRLVLLALEHVLESLRSSRLVAGLRLVHTITYADKLSINILETSRDCVAESLLDLLLDETGCERAKCIVQGVVLAVANAELERVDFNIDVLDLEDGRLVLLRRGKVDGDL